MSVEKDPKSPDTTSLAYDAMERSWSKIQTVLDGTEAMRAAEREYLPQHAEESDDAYAERLSRCTLFNLTKVTLDSWVGRPFSDPITFTDVPEKIENVVLEDVDLAGNDVHVFARNWFRDGLAKAYSHVFVDYPRVNTEKRTLAQDIKENVRPYWVHIRPEQLFFADAEIIDGREVLREIRIKEEVVGRDGFAEFVQPQIRRVFLTSVVPEGVTEPVDQVLVEIYWWKKTTPRAKKEKWVLVETYPISLPRIPLVTFYSDRDAFMHGTPPLEDLADLNIAHWQSTSDQRSILTVTRFPVLALSGGADDNKKLTIGPYKWLWSPDPQSKFYYVEHTGAAIEAGRQDLLDLETQMGEYGAEFLKKRPVGETATARALDSAEATSALQDITLRFADAMNRVLYLTAEWMKLETGGVAELSTDFGPEDVDQAELNCLRETRKQKDISRETYLGELKRRGLLSEEFDIEEDTKRLEDENLNLFGDLELPPPPGVKPEEEEEEEEETE